MFTQCIILLKRHKGLKILKEIRRVLKYGILQILEEEQIPHHAEVQNTLNCYPVLLFISFIGIQ